MKTIIIYPNQIYKNISHLFGKKVILVQDSSFFDLDKYNISKLVYQRAIMKFYEEYLKLYGIDVMYYDNDSYKNLKINNIMIYENTSPQIKAQMNKYFKNIEYLFFENKLHYLNNEYTIDDEFIIEDKFEFDTNTKNIKIVFENKFINESITYFENRNGCKYDLKNYYPISFDEANVFLAYYLRQQLNKDTKAKEFKINKYVISLLKNSQISLEYLFNMIMTSNVSTKKKKKFISFLENERVLKKDYYTNYLNNPDYHLDKLKNQTYLHNY